MTKIIFIDDGRANMRIRAALLALAENQRREIRVPADSSAPIPIAAIVEPKNLEKAIRVRREIATKNR